MGKVKVKLDINGLRELMKSDWMQGVLDEQASSAIHRAGTGYGSRTHIASYVAITNIYPETKEAAKDNYDNKTLQKALGG